MRHWFLSYNSQDLALMEALESALRRKDPGSTIFFAPKSLRAGGYWLPQLADEIAAATAVVLLVGEAGIGRWQVDEYYEARDKRVPVILVLLDGQSAPGLPFLRTLHWIVTPDPASESSLARLMDAAAGDGSPPGELWRHTAPYRGLAAMTEADSDFFFGRRRETVEVVRALAAAPDKLAVLLGNSGVGKSSLAQAGVLAALSRQDWPDDAGAGPWPQIFSDSRRWCFLTVRPGVEPVRALVEAFLGTWRFEAGDPARVRQRNEWVELLLDENQKTSLADLLDETVRRQKELNETESPGFILYVDQGEELYVRSEPRQRAAFSRILARGLGDPRLRGLMSLRADFSGALQADEPLFEVYHRIEVPPLREAHLREVVSRPAELLSARFETDHLAEDIARRTAEESVKDVGALPLLSYLLDDMWTKMVERGDDGVLRLPPSAMELGGVLVERADAFLSRHPHSEETLRRLLTLKLAAVREDGEPARRRALRSEFSDEEWRLVSELADHPNRLLITATPETGEAYAEVAHEAIFRRWKKLEGWIAQEREFLIWKSALEASRRGYDAAPADQKADAVLMGLSLTRATDWLASRAADIPQAERGFIAESQKVARRRRLRSRGLAAALVAGIAVVLAAWWQQEWIRQSLYWLTDVRGYVLTAAEEEALHPGGTFMECRDCPEMVVVPAGAFIMGSPEVETGHADDEGPQHEVTIAIPFAVSKFEVTFAEWDACGDCLRTGDSGWGHGQQPVINVSWNEAQEYVAWLSRMTGRPYRLLSEAEWEYAARAGSTTAYSWGPEIGVGKANCSGCGSEWDGRQTAPVDTDAFAANAFGLHQMHGNVWEWVEDCYAETYDGAPTDGRASTIGDCSRRVLRGGSWNDDPEILRAANRSRNSSGDRLINIGFRVGRTLTP